MYSSIVSTFRANWSELTAVPRMAVRFPLELALPDGFDAAEAETWPLVDGRLEYVGGRLLFMAPSGGLQQLTAGDLLAELGLWSRQHPDFVVGGDEAGMILGGEVRAADAAVWRRVALPAPEHRLPQTPPVLAVEIAGRDEDRSYLRDKARWYLEHGVALVWLLYPERRSLDVVTSEGIAELSDGGTFSEDPRLPGLAPAVSSLFRQIRQLG
jgi:Uma2 family endonuclease